MVNIPQEVGAKALQRFQDLELIHRSQAGNTEAFGELVAKYRSKLFTMVYAILGNDNDAWDLAQEGFLKAWQSIHRFEGRSSFYPWLRSITVKLTIESLRRKGRWQEAELSDVIPTFVPGGRPNYERAGIQQQVNAALAQLSPELRVVIVLRELEDIECREIAEILHLSLGMVMSRLFNARKTLQSILEPLNYHTHRTRPPVSVQ